MPWISLGLSFLVFAQLLELSIKLDNFYHSFHKFINSFPMLLSTSTEFSFWLMHFSALKFPLGSSLYLLFFAEIFYIFICFKSFSLLLIEAFLRQQL